MRTNRTYPHRYRPVFTGIRYRSTVGAPTTGITAPKGGPSIPVVVNGIALPNQGREPLRASMSAIPVAAGLTADRRRTSDGTTSGDTFDAATQGAP